MSGDGVGDVLLSLAELLHIVRDDGLVSCGGHFAGLVCFGFGECL